jgi:hypothetical protein
MSVELDFSQIDMEEAARRARIQYERMLCRISDEVEVIVDSEFRKYRYHRENEQFNLLEDYYSSRFSYLFKNCLKRYCDSLVSNNVNIRLEENRDLSRTFQDERAFIAIRGGIASLDTTITPFEVRCTVDNLPEDFVRLKDDESPSPGIKTTKYLANKYDVEKTIMSMIVQAIGNEILMNIDNLRADPMSDGDYVVCEMNCSQVYVNLEPRKMKFGIVAGINVLMWTFANEDVINEREGEDDERENGGQLF